MNKTTEKQSITVKIADNIARRTVGLLFKKELNQEALILYPCNSIHMFFMKFPIDVVFLSKEKEIVRCIEHLKPWKVSPFVKESYYVLELPLGTINFYNLRKGLKMNIPMNVQEFKLQIEEH